MDIVYIFLILLIPSFLHKCKHAKTVHHNYSYAKRQNNQQLYCWLPDSIYADYGNSSLQPSRNIFQWVRTTHLKSLEVLGTLGKVHRALPMTQGTSSHSNLFCIIMYKYKALPLQIIISLPILMSLLKLRITLNLYVLFWVIRKIYPLALYLL